jgi:Flp pilus assembly protein TadD
MAKSEAGSKLIFCLLLLSSAVALSPQGQSIRTVSVRIAIDNSLGKISLWKVETSSYLYECRRVFEDQFGIKLNIREYGYWCPDSHERLLAEAMSDLKKNVPPGGCDIVLGIVAPERISRSPGGISSFVDGYILLQNIKLKSEIRHILLHELCHIFGAIDLREKGSIMSTAYPEFRFDNFTKQTVLLHKFRSFDRTSFTLPQENLDGAIALFGERAALHLNEPEVNLYLTQMYLEKKDCEAGLRTCNELARANPHLVGIHNVLGNSYFTCGQVDQAITEYRQAVEIQPGEPGTHYNLGQAYFKKGITEAAEAEYKNALQLNPAYLPAHSNLGYLYLLTGKLDAAIGEYRVVLAENPACVEALHTLGSALLLKGEPSLSAISMGARDESKTDLNIINELRQADRLIEEATVLCKKALSLSSSLSEAHNTLGVAYAYQQRFNEAEAEFLKALETKPGYPEAHYNLALFYYKNGNMDKVVLHLRRFFEITPSSELELQILARIFQAQNTYAVFAENIKK